MSSKFDIKKEISIKGVMTIVGGFLFHILNGSVYSWGNLNPYLISYLKTFNSELTLDEAFFFMPFAILASTLTLSLGGYLETKIGSRLTLLIGSILVILGHLGLYLSTDLIWDYVSLVIFGFGIGVNYMVPIRTAWGYFPKYKGRVVGIIISGFGISASLMNFIAEAIINPNEIPVDSHGYYPEEVTKNMKTYLLFVTIAFTIIASISLFLVTPYSLVDDVEQVEDYRESQLMPNSSFKTVKYIFDETNKNETVLNAICSKKFIACFTMSLCSSYFLFLVVNTFRNFVGKRQDVVLIKYLAIFYSIMNGLARPIWGMLFDKYHFKKLFIAINVLICIISSSFYFIPTYATLLGIFIPLSGALQAGVFSLMPSLVAKLFGVRLSSQIYGVNFIAFGISGMLGPLFIFSIIHSSSGDGTPYLIVYMAGAVCSVISIIVCIFTDEEEHIYS